MAARLRAETGMGWVDAPVSGGAAKAAAGAMSVMASGTEEAFAAAALSNCSTGVSRNGTPGSKGSRSSVGRVLASARTRSTCSRRTAVSR